MFLLLLGIFVRSLADAAQDSGSADSNAVYLGGKPDTSASVTDRAGVNSKTARTLPTDLTGLPFDSNMNQDWSSTSEMESAATTGEGFASAGCTATGFQCQFPADSIGGSGNLKIGGMETDYKPEQFQWKAVDPLDYTATDWKDKRTLNCKLPLAKKPSSANDRLFYVATGKENTVDPGNTLSTEYCEIEQVRRTVTQDNKMIDEIRLRAETGRLDKGTDLQTQASFDLIGEQFDLLCSCQTNLDVEVSFNINYAGDMTVITADQQTRDLPLSMELYSSASLAEDSQVVTGGSWPADTASQLYQYFYFVAKHAQANDWDVTLQITSCVACTTGASDCSTYSASNSAVMFYRNCTTIAGGPQRTEISASSWFRDPTVTPPSTQKQGQKWSDSKPEKCPYDALGIQKFRISTASTFLVKCRITACMDRPCNPCSLDPHSSLAGVAYDTNTYLTAQTSSDVSAETQGATNSDGSNRRRQLFKSQRSRRLQDGDAMGNTELGLAITLPSSATGGSSSSSTNGSSGSSSNKKKAVNVLLILVILLLAALSMAQIRRTMKKNAADNKAKVVQPTSETASESVKA